jgi:hypothetical protein
VISHLRKFLRGYGANFKGEIKIKKAELIKQIKEIDEKADLDDLSKEEWSKRYGLKEDLTKNLKARLNILADMWSKMDSRGDSNAGYFHSIANGRRNVQLSFFILRREGSLNKKN